MDEEEERLIYDGESYRIQGAIFEVYKRMGCGFLENVYQECLEIEFRKRSIPFDSQRKVSLEYDGNRLNRIYKPDFVCYDKIIVELKSVRAVCPEHIAQVINYLKCTGFKLGFLVNFGGHPKVEIRRIVL